MPTRVYIPTEPYTPTGESMYAQPPEENLLVRPPEPEQGALSRGINRLLGTQFGEERYQTWPEKMIRSAATLAGDVVSGAVPVLPPGSRREDFTDEPAPGVPDNAPWWKMAPVAAQPNDLMMERAQDLAGVAMGGGIGGTGKAAAAGEAVLGSGPIMVVARKMPTGELKTGKPGQIHSDLLTDAEIYAGVNTAPGEMGFALPDGRYLTRNQALEYATKNEPERAYDANAKGRGLEAVKYNEAPEAAAGGKTLRSGMGDEGAGPVPLNQKGPPWFSAVENALEQSTTGSAPGAQWLATLRNSRGVKPEEMAWLGLDDYLAAAQVEGRKVTRAELQDYVRSHQVELRDVEKDKNTAKYHDYQLPGGENYRELLMTLPDKQKRLYKWEYFDPKTQQSKQFKTEAEAKAAAPEGAIVNQKEVAELNPSYNSSHWDEPNILAHMRMNDRTIDGKKSLHLEEIQSDWHQAGRDKGYRGQPESYEVSYIDDDGYRTKVNVADKARAEAELKRLQSEGADEPKLTPVFGESGVPDAPFKKNWHELALKRALQEAVENGYDRLSWTPGDAQAARYDLSKQLDGVKVIRRNDGSYDLQGFSSSRNHDLGSAVPENKLADTVGKDLAKKIIENKEKHAEYSGLDLKVGGEGMRGFYDQILPKALEKIGREHGVKVHRGGVETKSITRTVDDRYSVTGDPKIYSTLEEARKAASEPIFYIDIPQSLRDAAMRKGFPLFSGGKMFVPHQEEDK